MQYHLNGFRTGDPHTAAPDLLPGPEGTTDVAIIGCGPAGLTLAAQLAQIGGLRVQIFDAKPGPLEIGQADGIACRSMEMFEAMGFVERVRKEAYWVNETVFWRPDDAGTLARADRIQDVEDGLSHQPHVILSQARLHAFYLDIMARAPIQLAPTYGHQLTAVTRTAKGDYPVTLTFACPEAPEPHKTLRARYVVGCDGARSTVRQAMGLSLKGAAGRQLWGVMDVLAVTDFPDIRLKAAVQSRDQGSLLIIPREGDYLVRLYIELDQLTGDERAADRQVTAAMLTAKAQAILAPYRFEVREVAWFSAYEIGQRVCDRFDDAGPTQPGPRIFIAGDACHTHSPKAGQGMNVSMADTFNLAWKLAAVLKGQARPALLHSYSAERRAKAKELIDFDREMARLFSIRPETPEQAAVFQRYFQQHGRYTAGVETTYEPSLIVGHGRHQALAGGLCLGKRLPSAPVIRLADARPLHLGQALLADGRWRLLAFCGSQDRGQQGGDLAKLAAFLQEDPGAPLRRYAPPGAEVDAVIDLRAVFQHPHRDLDVQQMPPLLRPAKGIYGLTDPDKIFCPDPKSEDIFDQYVVARDTGALIILRPDLYVAHVMPLTDHAGLRDFFAGFMLDSGAEAPRANSARSPE